MLFELENVKYKSFLHIPSLTIPEGQVTSILGPSGSGKTTLLRMLNHMISPDCGIIRFQGKPLEEWNPVALRRKVVMLAQQPAIYPGSIRDNLLIGLQYSEKPTVADSVLQRMLAQVLLEKALDEDAGVCSGGEKQRIAIGRILLMQPEVLLLDEPSSALDQGTEASIIQKMIENMRERAGTIIMVTHAAEMAKTFSDNRIYLQKGRLAEGVVDV